ncbi:MAG: hypothetical protein N2255_06850 [Kiritimatiellae bacterium]|nr:hypothetical protein [Kiritimatiellia bacterium]
MHKSGEMLHALHQKYHPKLNFFGILSLLAFSALLAAEGPPSLHDQLPNTWIKRSPLSGGPPSPRLGYESSWCYDPRIKKMIRWGGHDPGGGGPQLSETWLFDPVSCTWELPNTNNNPPGNCCCRDNGYDPVRGVFVRFSYPAFGHGWMWDRSRYLREQSIWTYDAVRNRWKNMKPGKEPALNVGKGVAWDPNAEVFWVYDTRLRVYDPYINTWFIASQPPLGKRTYFAFALHPLHNKLVLFGDHYQSDQRTWVYDINKDEWTDMQPGVHPPGDRSCPTMVYDSVNNVMICLTLAGKWDSKNEEDRKLQTWVYRLEDNTWVRMNPPQEPDYSGTRGRLMWFLPDFNLVILENRTDTEQQIWTYRYNHPKPERPDRIPAPKAVELETTHEGTVRLHWEPVSVPNRKVLGYRVYRRTSTLETWKSRFEPLTHVPVPDTQFTDEHVPEGYICTYYVTTVVDNHESEPSRKVRAQPALVEGLVASVIKKDTVLLNWLPDQHRDIVGYVVERAPVEVVAAGQIKTTRERYDDKRPLRAVSRITAIGPFQRLTPEPLKAWEYTDIIDLTQPATFKEEERTWRDYIAGGQGPAGDPKTFDLSAPGVPFSVYAYRVRSVNRLGVIGGPCPYQLTIPNEIEGLVARESGSSVDLKWSPSPHSAIMGYLVYRQDGRGDDTKISLLTAQPIKSCSYTDTTAGGIARRYHIVVVDALGQEGIPSAPVWGFRPWREHYAPWIPADGWHQ